MTTGRCVCQRGGSPARSTAADFTTAFTTDLVECACVKEEGLPRAQHRGCALNSMHAARIARSVAGFTTDSTTDFTTDFTALTVRSNEASAVTDITGFTGFTAAGSLLTDMRKILAPLLLGGAEICGLPAAPRCLLLHMPCPADNDYQVIVARLRCSSSIRLKAQLRLKAYRRLKAPLTRTTSSEVCKRARV